MVYKDEEYLKKEIMGQNRHQFIYGYDNEQRKILLQKLDGEYLVKNDCDYPICIYLNEFGLPKILGCTDELDNKKINILSREHLSFTIVQAILEKTK